MPTYTQPGAVWISAGGEIVCRDHGGSCLTAAIVAGQGPEIVTPLDDWLYHSPENAAQFELTCEVCARQLPAEAPRKDHPETETRRPPHTLQPTDAEREL